MILFNSIHFFFRKFFNKNLFFLFFFLLFLFFFAFAQEKFHVVSKTNDQINDLILNETIEKKGCVSCHFNLESIMPTNSGMMEAIYTEGEFVGDPHGCVVCHGGNPNATTKEEAHQGSPEELKEHGARDFYPNPGDLAIAEFTCGLCHETYIDNLKKSLMNNYSGGISKLLENWDKKKVNPQTNHYATKTIKDEDPTPNVGTEEYFSYMKKRRRNKKLFPDVVTEIPHPTLKEIEENPSLIAFAFHQNNCNQCHVNKQVKNQLMYQKKNYRSMGCSACHMPYAEDGKYKGNDISIDKEEQGHVSLHQLNISDNGGIPLENCFSCHQTSYNGDYQKIIYESKKEEFQDNYDNKPLSFFVKEKYQTMEETIEKKYTFQKYQNDIHHQANNGRGMLCQDCHTTIDAHGDGNLFANAFSQVEIECQDCHGTPNQYPWELPLGYGDEYGEKLKNKPRGISDDILPESTFAKTYPKKEGYLLTARGNPFGNVVKQEGKVIVYTVRGDQLAVPLLKWIKDNNQWKNKKAKLAMENSHHMEKLECYACHSHSNYPNTFFRHEITIGKQITIQSSSQLSFINKKINLQKRNSLINNFPTIGMNQEGRYAPLSPQDEFIIKKEDGIIKKIQYKKNYPKKIVKDGLFLPYQPHSVTKIVKDCKDCHEN